MRLKIYIEIIGADIDVNVERQRLGLCAVGLRCWCSIRMEFFSSDGELWKTIKTEDVDLTVTCLEQEEVASPRERSRERSHEK